MDQQTQKSNGSIRWAASVENPAESANREALKQFKEHQKLESEKERQRRSKEKEIQKLNDMRKFSQSLKLKTSMPRDMAGFTDKGPTKSKNDVEAHAQGAQVPVAAASSDRDRDRDRDLCHIGTQFGVKLSLFVTILVESSDNHKDAS